MQSQKRTAESCPRSDTFTCLARTFKRTPGVKEQQALQHNRRTERCKRQNGIPVGPRNLYFISGIAADVFDCSDIDLGQEQQQASFVQLYYWDRVNAREGTDRLMLIEYWLILRPWPYQKRMTKAVSKDPTSLLPSIDAAQSLINADVL